MCYFPYIDSKFWKIWNHFIAIFVSIPYNFELKKPWFLQKYATFSLPISKKWKIYHNNGSNLLLFTQEYS